jgi:2-phosphoglycerate kinase
MTEGQQTTRFDWKVLLIGGSSAIGKTTIARSLGHRLGVSVIPADDIRLAIQQMISPAQQPALHYFYTDPHIWQRAPDVLRDAFIAISDAVSPALESVVAHHVVVPEVGPIIMEGDNVLPAMAARRRFSDINHFAGLERGDSVRAVFLVEPDEDALMDNARARGRGFPNLPLEEQRTIIRASWLYGQWLHQEAQTHGLPVAPVRPWDTVTDRILAMLG